VNDRFMKACFREDVDRTPVWMMRQAGRYLPEYRAIRAEHDFLTMCKTPALAAEVTVQPVDILGVDAAILFSDILILPEAMGCELRFRKDHGPEFPKPVRTLQDIDALSIPDPVEKTGFVMDAIHEIKTRLAGRVPLIGFAGAPYTVASYMVEGGGSKDYQNIKTMALSEPAQFDRLMEKVTTATIDYLNAQIDAGVDAVQVFDTWAGTLSERMYLERVLPHVKRIFKSLNRNPGGRRVATIYFAKNCGAWMEQIVDVGADVLGVDWTMDLAHARAISRDRVALQGNLDPITLFSPPAIIRAEVKRVLEAYGPGPGHIFNLGHGILPTVPPAHAKAMVDAVHEFSAR
jgi:uroporphyrinogen decarboxylase